MARKMQFLHPLGSNRQGLRNQNPTSTKAEDECVFDDDDVMVVPTIDPTPIPPVDTLPTEPMELTIPAPLNTEVTTTPISPPPGVGLDFTTPVSSLAPRLSTVTSPTSEYNGPPPFILSREFDLFFRDTP